MEGGLAGCYNDECLRLLKLGYAGGKGKSGKRRRGTSKRRGRLRELTNLGYGVEGYLSCSILQEVCWGEGDLLILQIKQKKRRGESIKLRGSGRETSAAIIGSPVFD